jgi:hypothetical protein
MPKAGHSAMVIVLAPWRWNYGRVDDSIEMCYPGTMMMDRPGDTSTSECIVLAAARGQAGTIIEVGVTSLLMRGNFRHVGLIMCQAGNLSSDQVTIRGRRLSSAQLTSSPLHSMGSS